MILNTKLQNILTGMNNPIKKVNAYNGWDPLKQIILGNVMSPSFFEDIYYKNFYMKLRKI